MGASKKYTRSRIWQTQSGTVVDAGPRLHQTEAVSNAAMKQLKATSVSACHLANARQVMGAHAPRMPDETEL